MWLQFCSSPAIITKYNSTQPELLIIQTGKTSRKVNVSTKFPILINHNVKKGNYIIKNTLFWMDSTIVNLPLAIERLLLYVSFSLDMIVMEKLRSRHDIYIMFYTICYTKKGNFIWYHWRMLLGLFYIFRVTHAPLRDQ